MGKDCSKKIIITLLTALVVGCSASPSKHADEKAKPRDTLSHIKRSLDDARKTNDGIGSKADTTDKVMPAAVSSALMPGYNLKLNGKLKADMDSERFDITVNRIAARPFFMSLVKGTPLNMVVHPDVKGAISLDLKNVTVNEVMEVVREVYGFEYERTYTGYIVMAARLQSKIFHVNYLNISRMGESNTRVTSGQISETENNSSAHSGSSENNNGNNAKAFSASKIATTSAADFWSELEITIKTIVGSGNGRSVVISPQAGLVVVRAMPGELRDVHRFLSTAQLNLHRQVILEAKIIEVELNDTHQAGINWAALDTSSSSSRANITGQFQLVDGQAEVINDSGEFLTSAVRSSAGVSGFGNMFAIGAASNDFAAIIRLLHTQGNVNVLSSPRVSTVNNQKAVIKVGSDEFFVTEVSSTTVTGTSTTTTPQITLTPFFSGIALDVTPQINEKGEVILHIHPTVSQVRDQTKDITVAGETQSLPLAFSTVRESDSIVRAKNGQVIVIGGLMQDQTTDNKGQVPGLGKIPLLGRLFRQRQKINTRSELVILLKPLVVDSDGVWDSELEGISDRISLQSAK